MIKTLLSYYFLEKIFPNTNKTPEGMVCCFMIMVTLAMIAAVSVVVSECFLAHYGYRYLTQTLQYTESNSWLILAGAFFLQAAIVLAILAIKINRASKVEPSKENKAHSIMSAFIKGFNSTY